MTLNTIVLFSILTILTSCNGQSTSKAANRPTNDRPPIIAKGDTVRALADNTWYVFQDKKDIYWFGSDGQGVYRYDGKTITHFTTKDGLCANQIRGIQEDKSGNIYFATIEAVVTPPDERPAYRAGISKFDGKTFSTLSPIQTNSTDNAWKLQVDDLWFPGAQDSGVVYRYDGKSLHRLEFPKTKAGEDFSSKFPRSKYPGMTYSPYDVYSIFRDSKGNLWFGTSTLGVCRYDGTFFTWISENELGYDLGDRSFGVRSTIEDKDGKFWFSNTLHRWDVYQKGSVGQGINPRKEKGIGQSKGQNADDFAYFMSSTKDNNGDLWMATCGAGVWRYDGEKLTHYPVKDGDKTITLFSIYGDNQGTLWLGSHENGALRFNGKTFEKFRP